mmetsp:Transcript_7434/g.18297  ORF Transcript_7434/g.18297 Transcript_7434/m.18297 type:complete len:597 (+) Transcript_7434:3095-4885(+)
MTSLLSNPPLAHAGGLLQFPPGVGQNPPLKNKYHLMRAGQSELEAEDGIYSTNALFLTNRENQLDTSVGIKQVSNAIQQIGNAPTALAPTVVYHSLAANGMDSGDQIARELRLGRDRLLPEFTYLDPRGIGLWDSSDINEIQPAIWAMDFDEAGVQGFNGRPPAKDDGTSNEVLHDQFIRLRQFVSLQESRTSGECILIIFPDSTGPALLSCMFAGIPFNEVHSLEFEPGEVRFDVNRESILALWKERREAPAYLKKIEEGREKLAALRQDGGGGEVNRASYTNSGTNGNFVSKKDEKIEKERLDIERKIQEKKEADAARADTERKERAEAEAKRREEYEQKQKKQMEDRQRRKEEAMEAARQKATSSASVTASKPSSSSLSPKFAAVSGVGAVGVAALGLVGTGGESRTDESADQIASNVTTIDEGVDVDLSQTNVTNVIANGESTNGESSALKAVVETNGTNDQTTTKALDSPPLESIALENENELLTNATKDVVTTTLIAPDETISKVANTSTVTTTSLYGGTGDLIGNAKEPSPPQSTSQGSSTSTETVTAPKIEVEDGDDGADDWLTMLAEIQNEEDEEEEDNFFDMTDLE